MRSTEWAKELCTAGQECGLEGVERMSRIPGQTGNVSGKERNKWLRGAGRQNPRTLRVVRM